MDKNETQRRDCEAEKSKLALIVWLCCRQLLIYVWCVFSKDTRRLTSVFLTQRAFRNTCRFFPWTRTHSSQRPLTCPFHVMHTKLKLKSKLRNKWIPLSPMNCLLDWFLDWSWREVCAHIDPSHPALCYQLLPQDVAVVRSFLRFLFHPSPFKPSTPFPIRNRWETFAAGYCQMEQILITTSASSVYSLRNSPPPPAPFCHLMCSTLVSDADVSSWCV